MIRLALFQPDIPQNAGTMLRLAACLGVAADIVEPAGFPVTDRAFRRAGLDYLDHVEITRHVSFASFSASLAASGRRLVLLTTRGETPLPEARFGPSDTLMVGRESSGAPPEVHAAAAMRVRIPIRDGLRSMNVAAAAAMALSEALRQTDGFPADVSPV